MLYFLLVMKEVAIVLFLLTTVSYAIYSIFNEVDKRKMLDEKLDGVAEKILELASDDKPIMLNVNQERLIEKVADEIERRSLGRES